jgi:Transglycosylase SLT domain
MFANDFDQDLEPEYQVDYPDEWEDFPSEWEDGEYLESDEPDFSPGVPDYDPSDSYTDVDYPAGDFALGALQKFLFVCTLLACLVLAAGLSLVVVQLPDTGSQAITQSSSLQSQPQAVSQPQADAALAASPDNSNCSVSQRYPSTIRRWCGLITQYAGKHGLPPDLVAALIWQESGGNPVAYSSSGAVGLMQVMPSDGLAASFQCAAGPCFSSRPSTDELKNPEFNVSYGTRMLAGLVGRTGDLREALKSYGPANVGYYYADKVLGIYKSYRN